MAKIQVWYVGLQKGYGATPDFHLVDEPSGSTKCFNPEKHAIIGLSEAAVKHGRLIPADLIEYVSEATRSCGAYYELFETR